MSSKRRSKDFFILLLHRNSKDKLIYLQQSNATLKNLSSGVNPVSNKGKIWVDKEWEAPRLRKKILLYRLSNKRQLTCFQTLFIEQNDVTSREQVQKQKCCG